MASINRYQTIDDIPASKGKSVLFKILNSPRADFSRLQKIASDYEKTTLEMMKAELCKNEPFCNWRWQRLLLFRFRSWVFKFRGQFLISKKSSRCEKPWLHCLCRIYFAVSKILANICRLTSDLYLRFAARQTYWTLQNNGL